MKAYKKIIVVMAVLLMFLGRWLPPVLGLGPVGMATIGIFAGTLLLLMSLDLMWPVFLCLLAVAVSGIYSLNDALRMCLGNSIFWFMMINGMVVGTIEKTGLFRRIALWLCGRSGARKDPWLFLTALLGACLLCGSIMNTTAVSLLFFALAGEVLAQMGEKKGGTFGMLFMMSVLAAANISHAVTPFGHSITIMSIDYFAEYQGVEFLQYSMIGYFCAILGLIGMILLLRFVFRMDLKGFSRLDIKALTTQKQGLTKAEFFCAVLYAGVLIWWVSPVFLERIFPSLYAFMNQANLNLIAPLLVALVALCIVPIDGKPVMDMAEGIKRAPWHAGMAVAVSLFLGTILQNPEAGIIEAVSGAIAPICGKLHPLFFVAAITLVVMVMSNFTSCTLSLMVGGIVTVTLMQSGAIIGIHGGALSIALAFSAQSAFATAPASAPAAICAGEGWVTPGKQMRTGMICAVLWWLVGIAGYGVAVLIF